MTFKQIYRFKIFSKLFVFKFCLLFFKSHLYLVALPRAATLRPCRGQHCPARLHMSTAKMLISQKEYFSFRKKIPTKRPCFFLTRKKSKNQKSDDVRQDKYRQHTRRLSGQKRSKLCDLDGILRPLLPIVLEKGSQRLRGKKASCHRR